MGDVLIIGGGIMGMLTAREMHMAGAEVTLIERNSLLAQESSWAGGGIISPLYPWRYPDSITRLASMGHQVYPSLCEQLREDTGVDPEYRRSGLLIHARDEQEQALSWAEQWGHTLSVEDSAAVKSLEPARSNPPNEFLWMPEIGQVRNPRLAKALIRDLHQRGISIHTDAAAREFNIRNDRVIQVDTTNGTYSANKVMLCTGAWTSSLGQALPTAPDIHPVRGQMLLFRGKPGLIRHMMLEENRYIIPRRDGHVLFGSTLEESGFEKHITCNAREELEQLATKRFPVLAECPVVAHWAGLRPASPAGVPYICRHPQLENLYINAGHFRNGVVLAPASSRLAMELLTGTRPSFDPSPYRLDAPRG
ncbi:glycine oxidase ThiO [Thiolapillus sp.]